MNAPDDATPTDAAGSSSRVTLAIDVRVTPTAPAVEPDKPQERVPGKPFFWHIWWVHWGWVSATILYLAAVGYALCWAVTRNFKLPAVEDPDARVAVFFTGLLLSLLPTWYWWWITSRFEKWIDSNPLALSKEQLDFERSYFKVNAESAKGFWAAIVATFVAFLINSK